MHSISIIIFLFLAACAGATGLPTSVTAIVGNFARGPVDFAVEVDVAKFGSMFGSSDAGAFPAESQARQFFRNGGGTAFIVRIDPDRPLGEALAGSPSPPRLRGLGALLPLSDLGLLVCPELTALPDPQLNQCLLTLAELGKTRPLFTLLDPPPGVATVAEMVAWRQSHLPTDLANAAIHFPTLSVDPATWSGGSSAVRINIGASGTMAAVFAANDAARGIWKTPAGTTAKFVAEGLTIVLSNNDIDSLNLAGVDSLRNLAPHGLIVWGGRTLSIDNDDKYIATARTRRWILQSLQRDLSDAALQENDGALWTSLRSRTEAFLYELYQAGAFQGTKPEDAWFARCDSTTTSVADIAAHRTNVLFGVSLLRPAEFMLETITLDTLDTARPMPEVQLLISPPFAGEIVLSYPGSPGFRHTLLSSPTLTTGSWFDPGAAPGNGAWVRERVPVIGAKRFFRVKTESAW